MMINILPYIITCIVVIFAVLTYSKIKIYLGILEKKSVQLIGLNATEEIKAFAQLAIKSLMQKYPASTLEELVSKAIVAMENKFGKNILSEDEIEIIIRSVIQDIWTNFPDLFNSDLAKQNLQLKNTITTLSASNKALEQKVNELTNKLTTIQATAMPIR